MLGLPTAGSKRLICLKHGHSAESLSLDATYETFTATWPWDKGAVRCPHCPDKSPHPEGWESSDSWQKQQTETYAKIKAERATND
jgi:hypothetical protein